MDRASIISVLEDTKQSSNKCLEFLTEDDPSYYTFKERSESLEAAIAALREQETVTNRNGLGCEFCLNGEQLSSYDKYGDHIDMVFCPMCGRKLGGAE